MFDFVKQAIVAACLVTVINAITISPLSNLPISIEGANDNTITLEAGTYTVDKTIVLNRKVSIEGDPAGGTILNVVGGVTTLFQTDFYNEVEFNHITVNTGVDTCSFEEPLALYANFTITVVDPQVRDGFLNIMSDLGPWYNTRVLEDFFIEDCSFSKDLVTGTGSKALASPNVFIRSDCSYRVETGIEFSQLTTCGIRKESLYQADVYYMKIEANMTEYVTTVYGDDKLRIPVNREGNAVTYLTAQIDTVRNIEGGLTNTYDQARVDCSIIKLERPTTNNDRTEDWTQVIVQCQIPGPYTLVDGSDTVIPNNPYEPNYGPDRSPEYLPPAETEVPGSVVSKLIHGSTGGPLGGQTVVLVDMEGEVVASTTSLPDGSVIFPNIPAGSYLVRAPIDVDEPEYGSLNLVGDPDTVIDGETFVTVTNGQRTDAGVFPYDKPGAISGTLTTGSYDSPMSGVVVTLTDNEGILIAVTTTDSKGRYSFSDLLPSQYKVTVPMSGPHNDNLDDEPFEGDANLDGEYSVTTTGELSSVGNVDFHYMPPAVIAPPTSSISGIAYTTITGAPIGGVDVILTDVETGEVIMTTTTEPDGSYVFEEVPPNKYLVTTPTLNPNNPDEMITEDYHDPYHTGNRTPLTIVAGIDVQKVDFGYTPPAVISGTVRDTTGNTIGEVPVTLTHVTSGVTREGVTDENGRYIFLNLDEPGDYQVTIAPPTEYTTFDDEFEPEEIKVVDGDTIVTLYDTSISDVNFVLVQTGTIVGTVTMIDGTPIGGVPVTLIPTNGESPIVVYTNENGEYTFPDVEVGDYKVDVPKQLPNGVFLAIDPDGITDGSTTISFTDPNTSYTVPPYKYDIIGGVAEVVGSITGHTLIANTLGPIDGIAVNLVDADGVTVSTTTTSDGGNYLFTDIPAGTYTVTAPMLAESTIGIVALTDDPDMSLDGSVPGIAVNGNDVSLPPFLYLNEEDVTIVTGYYENITEWTSSTPMCVSNPIDGTCVMEMSFEVKNCDMTGFYTLLNLEIACAEEQAMAGACPTVVDKYMDLILSIQTNDMCKESEFKIEGAFEPDILLKTDNTYLTLRPNNRFTLGEMTYWSIRLWTNVTGIIIEDANIIKLERESDGDCVGLGFEPYQYTNDISLLTQTFVGVDTIVPPEIRTPVPVTAQLACASFDNTFNIIELNFTVRVDYLDSSGPTPEGGRRRRRNFIDTRSLAKRQTKEGEATVADDVGVVYDGDQLAAQNQKAQLNGNAQKKEEESNMTTFLIIGGIILLLLCCCCCCAGIALFIYRRRQRSKKEVAEHGISHSTHNFGGTSDTLQMSNTAF
eukprot:CFRG6233T1